jgi:hypothetical protein
MQQSVPRHLARVVVFCATPFLAACGDGTGPPGPPTLPALPALEQTPHSQLGGVRIAFERMGGQAGAVYWLDGGSGNSGGFTFGAGGDPALSPDGRRIAYRSLTDFTTLWDVYVVDPDGSASQQLSSEPGNAEGAPTWTTGGAVVWGAGGTTIRFVRHATGSAQPETIGSFSHQPGEYCPAYMVTMDGPPSVAPSGELLFVCQRQALYRMVPNGQPVLLHQPSNDTAYISHAAWSPNGQRVAFLSHRTAQHTSGPGFVRIYTLDATGGTPSLVAERIVPAGSEQFGNAPHLTLCWAGSDRIVFAAPTGRFAAHIFVVPAAGGTPVQLTSAAGVSDGSVSCSRGTS